MEQNPKHILTEEGVEIIPLKERRGRAAATLAEKIDAVDPHEVGALLEKMAQEAANDNHAPNEALGRLCLDRLKNLQKGREMEWDIDTLCGGENNPNAATIKVALKRAA